MIDSFVYTNIGARSCNEDCVETASYKEQQCFILCDGLGGHTGGEEAAKLACDTVKDLFEKVGYSSEFLKNAFEQVQRRLLMKQEEAGKSDILKTTLVILVVTKEQIQWGYIGDSRLYRFYEDGTKYQRTKDHSLVQQMVDAGELREEEIRLHEDRNKLLRAMGAVWTKKNYEISPVLEREKSQNFLLMTDGFWEYIYESEMIACMKQADSAKSWIAAMEDLLLERTQEEENDNYSAIAVMIKEAPC
ncbi:MAG: PP2C family protein-serine/threonine phosphatase [Wujia sp.]